MLKHSVSVHGRFHRNFVMQKVPFALFSIFFFTKFYCAEPGISQFYMEFFLFNTFYCFIFIGELLLAMVTDAACNNIDSLEKIRTVNLYKNRFPITYIYRAE